MKAKLESQILILLVILCVPYGSVRTSSSTRSTTSPDSDVSFESWVASRSLTSLFARRFWKWTLTGFVLPQHPSCDVCHLQPLIHSLTAPPLVYIRAF